MLGRALRAAALAAASLDARQEAVAAEKPALQELSLGRRVDLRPAPGALDIRAPDVVYPGPMLGDWKVTRVLTDVEFPRGKSAVEANVAEGMLARKGIQHDVFPIRFIRNEQLAPHGVVEDREFNTHSLIKAAEGKDVAVLWKMAQPNQITVSYPNGARRECKVRKRDTTRQGRVVEWSELCDITDLAGKGVAAQASARFILGRAVVSKWFTVTGPQGKEATIVAERADAINFEYYMEPGKVDPEQALVKLTYRLTLERRDSDNSPRPLEEVQQMTDGVAAKGF